MSENTPSYLIVQIGSNCANSMKANLGALSRQTHKNWHFIFLDDASEDATYNQVERYAKVYGLFNKMTLIKSEAQLGFAQHAWEQLSEHAENYSHVLLMNGWHRFSQDRALEKLAKCHLKGWSITWSKWRDQDGSKFQSGALHPYEEIRQQPWVFAAPLSFESKYFKTMKVSDVQNMHTNNFLLDAGLQAFGYNLCEVTIKRKFINEILFTYDQVLPSPFDDEGLWRDEWMSLELKHSINALANVEKKELRVDQNFFKEHMYEFTEMAFLGERYLTRRAMDLLSQNATFSVNGSAPRKVKEFNPKSAIASSLLEEEDVSELPPEEAKAKLLKMDIEDAEMMAEAGFADDALKFFHELLEFDPDNARIHTNIGVLYWNQEETTMGMSHFVSAMKNDKDNRDPVMNCAGAWVELGHIGQAKSLCKNYLAENPQDQPIKNLLAELENYTS